MIVYQATKRSFMIDSEQDQLVERICDHFQQMLGHPNQSEVRAWHQSLSYMYKVLNDPALPEDAGVAIEFKLPGCSRRVDFIVTGLDEEQTHTAVIIELKQWEEAKAIPGAEGMVETFIGGGIRPVTHPSYQAWSYASFFRDYAVAVREKPIHLHPCTYLHNYKKQDPEDLLSPHYRFYTDAAPPFMRGEIDALRAFIGQRIRTGDQKQTLYYMDQSEIRPSKSLQDLLASMLQGNEEFVLIDSQRLVFDTAMLIAHRHKKKQKKQVMVVEGGPGTGKSVVAINLLVKMTQQDLVAQYVTKNAAPRHVYEARLSGSLRKGRISTLFQTSSAYVNVEADSFDVLIADESHRLTDKSGLFRNKGVDQVLEIIRAARLSIFFIDESQRVTTTDFGSIDKIKHFAKQAGAEITHMFLDSQFRCDGSDGYIAWLDDVLEIRKTAQDTSFLHDYDFQVFDDPNHIKEHIYAHNQARNKARLLAGYCWDWEKDKRADPEHADIVLEPFNFRMSWNLNNTSTWAIDPESVDQIGCIHTSQGLEFDYVGLIIGLDLRYENGRIVTDHTKRARTDQSLKGIKTLMKKNKQAALDLADELIKNTYRTLMTRGMKGCYVYCQDQALADYLRYRLALKPENQMVCYPTGSIDAALMAADADD